MIRFHFCDTFVKNTNGKDFEDIIYNKISENKERDDLKNINSISCFTGSIYVLKTSKPKTRTIIEERNLTIDNEDIKVFFVRDIITNKNFDHFYGRIIFPQLKNGEWIKNNPLSEEDENEFVINFKNEKNVIFEERQYPSEELTGWLKDFQLKLNNEIFETEEWVKYALNNSLTGGMIENYVQTFRIVLNEIITKNEGELIKEQKEIKIQKYINHKIGIIYSKIEIDLNKTIYLLFNAAHVEKQAQYWNETIENIKSVDIDFENNFESISRKAFRSYPKWTVNKDELWFAIQKSTEVSNLSLTREQIDFFDNFKFPYYINGQAGSGKSTMLYYLFANAYYYKCCDAIKGDIIFLTENETLLKHTQNAVFDLLTNNPQFDGLTTEHINQSKNYFNSFKKFLIDILPENEKYRFKENKYLDFSKFKLLYESSNISKHIIEKYSAEEVWFTITTYIYGYLIDKKVTGNEYTNIIPNKSQIIPREKFKGIEENVLSFYEKLINEDGYWDKLKIIRFISKNISLNKKYSILICDEAQDFCRVELRFILRLSKYLEYDLSKTEQVPIVFAGDPNQTVNPTGFRQSEMTSMLYEELKEIAKFNYNPDKNIYNPTFNYRSTQPVVSIANFVQYHRMKNLGIKQVKPQEAKRPNSNIDKDFNIFINYSSIDNDADLRNNLIEKLKYKIFIIPVNSQEKETYVSNHKLLSLIDKVEVKTSVEAKGAEYEQVVLYGFGDYFIQSFKNLSEHKVEIEELFKKGFFYNKLYVGLTRAQTELIIIDSEQSKKLFWEKLVNKVDITSDKWFSLNEFKEKTIEYNPGSINNIIKSTPEDALKNAIKDKNQGIYDKNPARLKVAANQFFKIGNQEQGYECLALSEEIKENWKAAADYYLKSTIPNYEKAAICYFNGRRFIDLEKIGNNLKTIEQDIRIIIARLMNGEILMKQDIEILRNNENNFDEIIKNLDWRDDIINQLILSSKKTELIEQKKDFVHIFESIASSNDKNLWNEIGNIRFDLKNYKEAIEAWSEIDFFENNEKYYISQVELSKINNDFENIVLWFGALLKFKKQNERESIYTEIIEIYSKNNSNFNSNEYLEIIFRALVIQQPQNEKIIFLVKLIEKQCVNTLNQLIDFYKEILIEENLSKNIAVFIIERWAKTIWKLEKSSTEDLWLENLNSIYFKFSEKHKIKYKEFELNELENISEFPEKLIWKPSPQFKNFTIHNFRRFQDLTITNIGKYNLIVGDNNVGKTSLLEALLFSTNKDIYIENLAFAYIYRKNIPLQIIDNEEKYIIPTTFIINDFLKKDADPKQIEVDLNDNRNEWNFMIKPATKNEIPNIPNLDIDDYLSFVFENTKIDLAELPLIIRKINPKDIIKSPLIPFGKGFGNDLALTYYEEIEIVKQERISFLNAMEVFIPKIVKINANTKTGEIDIEEDGFDVAAPLHQYGEGANKLFRILVQLTLQKGKNLLIDEIDAGIHYSHFPEFWKTIITVANKNNVRIFATTHNIECVKYFSEILKEDNFSQFQQNSRIITLRELPEKKIKAYTRSFNEFEYELNNEFEIRGGDL